MAGDRHREKPLSLRFGEAERRRLEDYAAAVGLPVRRVVLDGVKAWLDARMPEVMWVPGDLPRRDGQ
jgi:hypothetical protein